MILETIISTIDKSGNVNFAPFGIKKIKISYLFLHISHQKLLTI